MKYFQSCFFAFNKLGIVMSDVSTVVGPPKPTQLP